MQLTEEKLPKAELRKNFIRLRNSIDPQEQRKIDIEIQSRVLCSREYSRADMLLTYISVENEPDTHGLIQAAFANGKKVAVPKCTENNGMEFYFISSDKDLLKGSFGLFEPNIAKCIKAEPTEKSLCVVPGLSFDASGFRLGRGGGYYDRFLKSFNGVSVGLCRYDFFRLSLPREPFDIPVDIIATESFLREIKPKL